LNTKLSFYEEVPECELQTKIQWDGEQLTQNGNALCPFIGSASDSDAVMINLDGRCQAKLDWSNAVEQADQAVSAGKLLFWNIDLGLFRALSHPLENNNQFLSLQLSLEHFERSIWECFHAKTLGLSIYQGPLCFSREIKWTDKLLERLEEWNVLPQSEHAAFIHCLRSGTPTALGSIFSVDIGFEFMEQLIAPLPDDLSVFACVDASSVENRYLRAQLLAKKRRERLLLAASESNWEGAEFAWKKGESAAGFIEFSKRPKQQKAPSTGFCLPDDQDYATGEGVFLNLVNVVDHIKVIPESHLTTEWDGLDNLIVLSETVSASLRRKLQGFCAAGGTVLTIGPAIGLAIEKPFFLR